LPEETIAPLTPVNIMAIAVALAMDAFAVAVATGICLGTVHWRQHFRLAWHFGFFQAVMPVIGWGAGLTVRELIAQYDHWVAFGLLLLVAQSMLREAFQNDDTCEQRSKDPTKGFTMVMLSVATSLDALAVGLSLSVVNVSIWTPAVIIGVVACAFTIIGLHFGQRISKAARVRQLADALGGTVLLLIGLNILREHGVFDGLL
jgi:putative Mn2+ efflux pump MntP